MASLPIRRFLSVAALALGASFAAAQSTPAPRIVPGYDEALRVCYASASSSTELAQQLQACKKAADAADMLPANALDRVTVYTSASRAFNRDHQFQEALRYANKAVDSAKQGHGDGIIASSAYAARAAVETNLGLLDAAEQDQSVGEDYLHAGLKEMDETHVGEFNRGQYIRALKSMLTAHAQMLTAQGNPSAAQAKTDEAAKLP
jgi:hypothetical protein